MPSKAKTEVLEEKDPFAPVTPPAIETLLSAHDRVARHEKEA